MASLPVTRASLIARAATRGNTSGYADPSVGGEISGLVDLSLAKLHNILVGYYEDYFTRLGTLDLVNNQDTYNLPPDLFKLRKVFYVDQSGYRWPMRKIEIDELTNVPLTITYYAVPYGYCMLNNQIVVFPKPTNVSTPYQILLFYIPVYIPPANDQQPIDFQIALGWDEWVVNDVVCQIRAKAMMPAEDVRAERDKLEMKIQHQAKQRDAGEPHRVRDTGWGGNQPYTRFGNFALKG